MAWSIAQNIDYPWVFVIYPVLLFILYFLLKKDFVPFSLKEKREKSGVRVFVFVMKAVILLLLLIALASPFIAKTTTESGNPNVVILVDNSTSMEVFETGVEEDLKKRFEKDLPVTVRYITSGLHSNIADRILSFLDEKNVLVITDGNDIPRNRRSIDLKSLVAIAQNTNTSINVLELKELRPDTSISLEGTQTAIVDLRYTFEVVLENIDDPVDVTVTIDGVQKYSQSTESERITLDHTFSSIGRHEIKAVIEGHDHFKENNEYYKVVDVVERPRVLMYTTRSTPAEDLLSSRYEPTFTSSWPSSLDGYHAFIINNQIDFVENSEASLIEDYLFEDNGVVVIGGDGSFRGEDTIAPEIQKLLPVAYKDVEYSYSDFHFVVLIDSSGYVVDDVTEEESSALDILYLLKDQAENIKVALVYFDSGAYVAKDFAPINDDTIGSFESVIGEYDEARYHIDGFPLYRGSQLGSGLEKARELFPDVPNKNIIVVSDGDNVDFEGTSPQRLQEKLAQFQGIMNKLGENDIRVHTVNFGDALYEDNRRRINRLGRGVYMKRIRDVTTLMEQSLVVTDDNHWITKGLSLSTKVNGVNKVTPLGIARLLVSTGVGQPVVTVDQLNKIAVISTDDGTAWAEQLYKDSGSALFYKLVDWAIGDPNRLKQEYVEVDNAIVGKKTVVRVRTAGTPTSDRCDFIEVEDHFECEIVPDSVGFDSILGVPFAVNYNPEYQKIGMNDENINLLTKATNGLKFKPNQPSQILAKVKTDSRVEITKKHYLRWYFLIGALVLYLIEIFIRRRATRAT